MRYNKRKIIISSIVEVIQDTVVPILFGIFIAIVFGLLFGCSSWKYKRIELDPNGCITTYIDAEGKQHFMRSEADSVHVKVTNNSREFSIGKIKQSPDINSIKSLAEGVATGVVRGITGK